MMATTSPITSPRYMQPSRSFSALKRVGIALVVCVMVADMIFSIVFYKHPIWVIDQAMNVRLRLAGFRSEYIMVGPYRVHYVVGGKGKPLLLIHGLGARGEDWTPEMPDYEKNGFRVYAIDLLGCGRTDRPDIAYTVGQQADLIHGFLDAVHIEKADVIGWSMGGWVALEFALQHPDSAGRLVAMDSAGLKFQTGLPLDVLEPNNIPQLKRLEALLMSHSYYIPAFVQRDLLRELERNRPVVHRTLRSLLTHDDDLTGRVGQLRMPVLVVWGAQDNLIPPSVGLRMHGEIRQSVLELYSDCGHLGPATCSDRIAPKVIDFLRSEPPMAGVIYHY